MGTFSDRPCNTVGPPSLPYIQNTSFLIDIGAFPHSLICVSPRPHLVNKERTMAECLRLQRLPRLPHPSPPVTPGVGVRNGANPSGDCRCWKLMAPRVSPRGAIDFPRGNRRCRINLWYVDVLKEHGLLRIVERLRWSVESPGRRDLRRNRKSCVLMVFLHLQIKLYYNTHFLTNTNYCHSQEKCAR